MFKIGITGGIGSGKTFICKMFEQLGIPVYYADERAKYLMNHQEEVINAIKATFGEPSYKDDTLNRAYLAENVFNNKENLTKLNNIVHPAVFKDTQNWVAQHQNAPFVLKEAALLFETGTHAQFDKNILVTAPEEVRIIRVMERDKVSKEQVEARMKNQLPDSKKMELADFIINNDGQTEVEKLVDKLYQYFSMSSQLKSA